MATPGTVSRSVWTVVDRPVGCIIASNNGGILVLNENTVTMTMAQDAAEAASGRSSSVPDAPEQFRGRSGPGDDSGDGDGGPSGGSCACCQEMRLMNLYLQYLLEKERRARRARTVPSDDNSQAEGRMRNFQFRLPLGDARPNPIDLAGSLDEPSAAPTAGAVSVRKREVDAETFQNEGDGSTASMAWKRLKASPVTLAPLELDCFGEYLPDNVQFLNAAPSKK
ncbi:unnamed protein product [Symbiodinium sp. CCMP2592]|nr:unnamed protein product [Symbiodinium sp. CCMP2592]